ncbi:MAG: phosphate signaling complex protein PhoU [Phycisphaerales bacterium]|nr:phosphate signaling complex protein PhoU [Phycisphaerales bacterium]
MSLSSIHDINALKDRLYREATSAVGMVDSAIDALWSMNRDAAREVKGRDSFIDSEEIAIEQECLRLMTLQQPFGRDFRILTFILKVNADIERVADHGSGIAKTIIKMPEGAIPQWPTALVELCQRVPMACHALLRALQTEDCDGARAIVDGDKTIDSLHRRLFDETLEMMQRTPNAHHTGLLVYRLGRELERIGDLMTNIAEDIVYLCTGSIVRHDKKLGRLAEAAPKGP